MMRSRSGRELPVMTIINCGRLVVLCLASAVAFAHEGHKPLPTRGMEVTAETGKMVLTRFARTTLDVQTAEVGPQKVSQSILAYGTLVSPWSRHAMVSSPLSGRIVELLVTPGESGRAGSCWPNLTARNWKRCNWRFATHKRH